MKIGIPKEIKNQEHRVALTPSAVSELITRGHQVLVEAGAGNDSGFLDEHYERVGASIVKTAEDAWSCQMVMKVKEPLPEEFRYFREGLLLFTYLHLAADRELTEALKKSRVTAVAYETVQTSDGSLPLLNPMSEVAGRMSTQVGAQFLEKMNGGKGILLGGVPGVRRGRVTVLGGGTVGYEAAQIAVGLGAYVTVLDIDPERLHFFDQLFGTKIQTMMSNPLNIHDCVAESDLLIGAVLIPGAKAPTLVTEETVKAMGDGSVIVDVAVDQGGIVETTDHVTTHDEPTYLRHGVLHYAVANMPGAVPRTSTIALSNVTVSYAALLADLGVREALIKHPPLQKGLNVYEGEVTYKAVADAHHMSWKNVADGL
ncbi:alanine dehydrogenase [Aureibacillus halotolerans]|uniref:Alanine dehydrogenase n=1 Tax=Aureibacillus halotolerans TaxID=1508390 RepID=A0A4R6TYT2_9BACI|nr:alanine dehydrogenase [Aureibacillus halotolerans]TDQ39118.1 L-alanine dehydrogenase [Aureibacillus halotolerans]